LTFIVGYRGLATLARRAGSIEKIEARLVYEGDDFSIEWGSHGDGIKHTPRFQEGAAVEGAYSVVTFPNGRTQDDYMPLWELNKIMALVRAEKGPWFSDGGAHRGEMQKKTVCRRILKMIEISPELGMAMEYDQDLETIEIEATEVPADEPEKTRTESLAEEIGADSQADTRAEKVGSDLPTGPTEPEPKKDRKPPAENPPPKRRQGRPRTASGLIKEAKKFEVDAAYLERWLQKKPDEWSAGDIEKLDKGPMQQLREGVDPIEVFFPEENKKGYPQEQATAPAEDPEPAAEEVPLPGDTEAPAAFGREKKAGDLY